MDERMEEIRARLNVDGDVAGSLKTMGWWQQPPILVVAGLRADALFLFHRVERLEAAYACLDALLTTYGSHDGQCPIAQGVGGRCNCGWSEAMEVGL